MMPVLAFLLLLTPPASRQPADAREIMRVVLTEEAALHGQSNVGPAPCVRRDVEGVTLNGRRRMLADQEPERNRPSAPPTQAAKDPIVINELQFSPLGFDWFRPRRTRDGYFGGRAHLSRAEDRAVTEAAIGIIRRAEQSDSIRTIDPAWLQKPLLLCENDPEQPYLEFSSPAASGDFAFVAIAFQCVMCGQGVILALKRERGRWAIVAADQQWVS
jgi:hypothetical protein